MNKGNDICFTFLGFGIGFALACLISFLGHPAAGAALIPILFFLGLFTDGVRFGWRVFWDFTQQCGDCGARVSPMSRARVSETINGRKYWFCSPRCFMEFTRRFKAEGKLFNFLFERGE